MTPNYRARRFVILLITAILVFSVAAFKTDGPPPILDEATAWLETIIHHEGAGHKQPSVTEGVYDGQSAEVALGSLAVKGRAPKTNYARTQFSSGWATVDGCSERDNILRRDLVDVTIDEDCKVLSGTLHDPYTGKIIQFKRGIKTSSEVQIDHVVALSNAWQTGAQQLSYESRRQLANDPLELLAVDGPANQQKGDGDAATWLPSYKPYRCMYVARQIAVKHKYRLWVTPAEKTAIQRVLDTCDNQKLPTK